MDGWMADQDHNLKTIACLPPDIFHQLTVKPTDLVILFVLPLLSRVAYNLVEQVKYEVLFKDPTSAAQWY